MSGSTMTISSARGLCVVAALAMISSSANAALPPQFQRVKEIRAILDDPAVARAFDLTHPIDKIERIENAVYQVSSGTCIMRVALVSDTTDKRPATRYGSWAFSVKAGPLICQ